MLSRSLRFLATPHFTLDVADPEQSIFDANAELDHLTNTQRDGTVKWCYTLLNRSMAYLAAKDYGKAREDAIDAHVALQNRCGLHSSNLYFSATVVSKVCAAFADNVDELEASEHITRELSSLLPRTIPALYRSKGMSITKYLRAEEKEYAQFARFIAQLPGHGHMAGRKAQCGGWSEGNSEKENW